MNKLSDIWHKSMYIFDKKQKVRLIFLLLIMFFEIFLELLGVISVYPFISLVLSPSMINENMLLLWLYTLTDAQSNEQFFFIVAILIILLYVFKNSFNAISNYLRYGFVYTTKKEIGVRLMRNYLREPYTFFMDNNSAVLMRGVGTDVSQFFDMVLQCLYVFSDCIMMITFGMYLIYADPFLSITIILV